MDHFVKWFESSNGKFDAESMALVDFPGQGRGAVALRDIPVCIVLGVNLTGSLLT